MLRFARRRRGNDLGYRLAETRHQNGLSGLRTFSSTARQVALSFEIAISSMVNLRVFILTMVNDYGQTDVFAGGWIAGRPTPALIRFYSLSLSSMPIFDRR